MKKIIHYYGLEKFLKQNRTVSDDFKSKIKTIFHHLTKEELIEKVLANHLNHLAQTNKGKQNK